MHINEKGQVTIPKDIRDRYGFLPFTEVEFTESNDQIIIVRNLTPRRRGLNILRALRRKGDIKCTTKEIMQYTRS